MAMTLIACALSALGVLLAIVGIVLVIKRMRVAGAIVTLFGVVLIAVPVLAVLYAAIAMQ